MKKLLISISLSLFAFIANAQVPYFSGTPGNGMLYGYTALKTRPGNNSQETYTCLQYGLGDQLATGIDIYTGGGSPYWGALMRWGKQISPYFGVGAQITPSFNLNDNFKYSYTTAALYMNGNISNDGKLFWCSNTWWGINKDADNTIVNWEFLGYSFNMKKGSITPMIGMEHDWKLDNDPDMLAGFYYSIGKWNIYAWGSDFFKSNNDLRLVIGVDFKLSTK